MEWVWWYNLAGIAQDTILKAQIEKEITFGPFSLSIQSNNVHNTQKCNPKDKSLDQQLTEDSSGYLIKNCKQPIAVRHMLFISGQGYSIQNNRKEGLDTWLNGEQCRPLFKKTLIPFQVPTRVTSQLCVTLAPKHLHPPLLSTLTHVAYAHIEPYTYMQIEINLKI